MGRLPIRLLVLGPVLVSMVAALIAFAVVVDRQGHAAHLRAAEAELRRAQAPVLVELAVEARPVPGTPVDTGVSERLPDEPPVATPFHLLLGDEPRALPALGTGSPTEGQLAALVEIAGAEGVVQLPEVQLTALLTPVAGRVLATALPTEQASLARAEMRRHLAGGVLLVTVVVGLLLWWLSGVLTRPLLSLAETAKHIAGGDLDRSVARRARSREVAALERDVDRMVARLRATIDAEAGSAALARDARDAMERLLADVAHELRTPLTALWGYSELLADGRLQDDAAVQRAHDRIGQESQRLRRLADDMLLLAREGTTRRRTEEVDVLAVVAAVVHDLRAVHPDRDIALDTGGADEPTEPAMVAGSAERLHQAVLNVAANACQHSPQRAPVRVGVQVETDELVVSVSDEGPGIDVDDVSDLFRPFHRGQRARELVGGGAGLGLAIADRVVREHDGRIDVTSAPGDGATFSLVLPRATPAA